MQARLLITIAILPSLMACEALKELGKPTEPSRPGSPDQARQQLSDLGVLYNQASFIEAAGNGNLNVVQCFIWAGMDPNVQPYTAAVVYVPKRNNPTRFAHLQYAWYPQEDRQDDDTALMKAAGNGHLDIVKFLFENGADARIKNRHKQQVLHFAAAGGHLDILEYFVDNPKGPIGLSRGLGFGLGDYFDMFQYDPLMNGPLTPIMWAAYGGHLDVVQYIHPYMKYYGIPFNWAAIYWAAAGGHLDVMEWLVEVDPMLKRKDILGHSLMVASYINQPVSVDFLLSKDANLFFRTSTWINLTTAEGVVYFKDVGFGPLHAAIQAGNPNILRQLLEHWIAKYGADGRDPHGMTGLHYAAAGGDVEMARAFIDNGAPVNAQSDIGVTALMFAAEWGNLAIVEMLLEAGADKDAISAYDDTAKTLAEGSGHNEIAAMLAGTS